MRAVAVAAVLLAALLAGCGGSGSPSPEDTVSAAVSGLSKGDATKVCAQLSPEGVRRLLVVLRDNPLGLVIHASTCREAVRKVYAKLSKPIRAALEDGEVALPAEAATAMTASSRTPVRAPPMNRTTPVPSRVSRLWRTDGDWCRGGCGTESTISATPPESGPNLHFTLDSLWLLTPWIRHKGPRRQGCSRVSAV